MLEHSIVKELLWEYEKGLLSIKLFWEKNCQITVRSAGDGPLPV